jgi:HK97 family phage major capsid protein
MALTKEVMALTQEERELLEKIKAKNTLRLAEVTTTSKAGIEQIADAVEVVEAEVSDGDYKGETLETLKAKSAELESAVELLMKNMAMPDKAPLLDGEPQPEGVLEHDFKSMDDFMVKLALEGPNREATSPELKRWRETCKASQSAGDPATGGTLIPTEYIERIMERARVDNPIMANATIIPMATGKAVIPFINGFDESQGKTAGNGQFYWEGESEVFTEVNALFGSTELNLRKLAASVRVTWELLKYSAISIEPILARMFDQSLSTALSRGFIRGTGVKMPKGILQDGGHKLEIPKAAEQVKDTYIYDNILDQVARHYSADGDIGNGFFMANKTTLPQLGKLSVVVGTGGSGIFLVNQQIQGKPVFQLLGLPLKFNGQMPIAGDAGDVTLADWPGGYLIGEPSGGAGLETEQSIHLYFNYGDTSFRAITAMDGAPWWPSEFKPAFGASQAPFVTIAARE